MVLPQKAVLKQPHSRRATRGEMIKCDGVAPMIWVHADMAVHVPRMFSLANDRNLHLIQRMRLFLIALLSLQCLGVFSQTNQPPAKPNAEAMFAMRMKVLTNGPAALGLKSSPDYPHVFGALMELPITTKAGPGTVSVVSLSTGDASVYTTGSFGVIGGIGHETVRDAAMDFVKTAEKHYDEAAPTQVYAYPVSGRVRFYLVCYDGVRVIDADQKSLSDGTGKCTDLMVAGARVMTELRKIVQAQQPAAAKP